MGHPRRTADRDRHLDRTHLPPSPTPGRARPVDPDRIRSNYDHTGQSSRVTQTVTYRCSRPRVSSVASEGRVKAVVTAMFANLGIAVTKFVAFLFTASSSMLAESVHSLADTSNQRSCCS